jgi:hypothetical protein
VGECSELPPVGFGSSLQRDWAPKPRIGRGLVVKRVQTRGTGFTERMAVVQVQCEVIRMSSKHYVGSISVCVLGRAGGLVLTIGL